MCEPMQESVIKHPPLPPGWRVDGVRAFRKGELFLTSEGLWKEAPANALSANFLVAVRDEPKGLEFIASIEAPAILISEGITFILTHNCLYRGVNYERLLVAASIGRNKCWTIDTTNDAITAIINAMTPSNTQVYGPYQSQGD